MSLITINWKPTPRGLREFGVVMLVGTGVLGGLMFWHDHRLVAWCVWAFGGICGVTGLSGTRLALPFYLAWMALAFILGNTISRLVMLVFFYIVIGGMGLIMKIIRRNRLGLRKPKTGTYWTDCPIVQDVEHYERQS
jgi:hypothetical protein